MTVGLRQHELFADDAEPAPHPVYPPDDPASLPWDGDRQEWDDGYVCDPWDLSFLEDEGRPSLPPIVPRDYQVKATEAAVRAADAGVKGIVKMATGLGKTPIMGMLARHWADQFPDHCSIFLAHQDHLVGQTYQVIRHMCPELNVQVEHGERRVAFDGLWGKPQAVVASVPTLCQPKRLARFPPGFFARGMTDECQHNVPKNRTFARILAHLRQNPDFVDLGTTATIDRGDDEALAQSYDRVVFDYPVQAGIDDGWLVEPYAERVTVRGLDYSALEAYKGDLKLGELEQLLSEEKPLHGMTTATYRLANLGGQCRPTLFFACRVAHAERVARIFNRLAARDGRPERRAYALSGKDDAATRKAVLKAHEAGEFQFLVVCGLFTEGFDGHWVRCVVPKPTLCRYLYEQMVGRGTRPYRGLLDGATTVAERKARIAASPKKRLLVLDFADNSKKHSLVHAGDIFAGAYSGDAWKPKAKKPNTTRAGELDAELIAARQELDAEQERRRSRIVLDARITREKVDPFAVMKVARVNRVPRWYKGREPTQKQVAYLEKNGVKTKGLTMWEAKSLIDEIRVRREKGLCSYKQAVLLKKFGYTDAESITFERAGELLDRIAANGWRRPDESGGEAADYGL